ncbi:hypothetical protein AAFC00_005999 [Neodothiora populina]|uniref:Uncharacterized protein n=1 Tax=Neodothiora populina TaxID=2781224 RepID=A0ABR3P7C9_9PEZI
MSDLKRILVVAGSDSSGGAGLEADQKVIAAYGCYAMTATTALTAQNTLGVEDIHATPSDFVKKQVDACMSDIGMLTCAETIHVVADAIKRWNIPFTVVDPVMVSTSGARLLPESAIKVMCDQLLQHTSLLTPNIPEALLILRETGQAFGEVKGLEDMKALARTVSALGPKSVLIKGGHIPLTKDYKTAKIDEEKQILVNVLYANDSFHTYESKYLKSRNTHGTGCSLASAIACNVASGLTLEKAVGAAGRYIEAGIRTSKDIGKGSGPINHFHSTVMMPFAPGGFIDYLLDRSDVAEVWQKFTHHEFVEQLGNGTLPVEKFKFYMAQDYLYLLQFARANALAGYKAKTLAGVAASAAIVLHIQHETQLHVSECEELGLSLEEMENMEEHQACTAYSRYILDVGQSEDWFALQMALLPCLLGYSVIAKRLHSIQDPEKPKEANRYRKWIDNYVADDYNEAVIKGCALVEAHAGNQSPQRIEELVKIFIHATRMEAGFWEMGLGA